MYNLVMKTAPRVLFALFFALNATACINFFGDRETKYPNTYVQTCGILPPGTNIQIEQKPPEQLHHPGLECK